MDLDLETKEAIYVIPMFMRPGRQFFVCGLPQKDGKYQFYPSKLIVKKREEDPPLLTREVKQKKIERKF